MLRSTSIPGVPAKQPNDNFVVGPMLVKHEADERKREQPK